MAARGDRPLALREAEVTPRLRRALDAAARCAGEPPPAGRGDDMKVRGVGEGVWCCGSSSLQLLNEIWSHRATVLHCFPCQGIPFSLTGLDTILAAGSFSLQVAVVEGQLALSTVGLQLGKGESYVNSESLVPGSVPMQR